MSIERNINELGLGLLRQPKTVIFGPGQRVQIPNLARRLGRHVLVCTDARMAGTAEYAELRAGLESAGVRVSLFDRTEPDLPRENIQAALEEFGAAEVDLVIGLGGGSCLDMAKVTAVMLEHGGDVRRFFGEHLVPGPGKPVITVPTTGGTGAEVSCISVVYDTERKVKVGVASPYLEAEAAVIDPELTLTCPPGLTAATGADALSHLIECFTDRAKNPSPDELDAHLYVGKNVLTDIYARHGLRLLGSSLEAVAADPADLQARADTMMAAFCGGMALNTAGTAAAHALQSPVGAITGTAHGFGVGALLPFVMRYNLPARVPEFAEMAELLGVAAPETDELERAKAAILRVEEILAALGVPANLAELGLGEEDVDHVAEQSLLSTRLIANNPRPIELAAAQEILRRGVRDDRAFWGDEVA